MFFNGFNYKPISGHAAGKHMTFPPTPDLIKMNFTFIQPCLSKGACWHIIPEGSRPSGKVVGGWQGTSPGSETVHSDWEQGIPRESSKLVPSLWWTSVRTGTWWRFSAALLTVLSLPDKLPVDGKGSVLSFLLVLQCSVTLILQDCTTV